MLLRAAQDGPTLADALAAATAGQPDRRQHA
jgi:hypothetical protein